MASKVKTGDLIGVWFDTSVIKVHVCTSLAYTAYQRSSCVFRSDLKSINYHKVWSKQVGRLALKVSHQNSNFWLSLTQQHLTGQVPPSTSIHIGLWAN